MKTLLTITIFLLMTSCGEQDYTENELLNNQVKALKTFCEKRQPCINDVEHFAVDCQKEHAGDLNMKTMSDEEQFMSVGFFGACIIEQMDERFQARFNKAFPVVTTNVKTSSSSGDFNVSYAFQNDPGYLQIHEVKGRFMVEGKSLQANEIMAFIEDNQLTDSFHSVALIVSGDLEVGLLIEAQDQIKAAGFKNVSIARKEHLEELRRQ